MFQFLKSAVWEGDKWREMLKSPKGEINSSQRVRESVHVEMYSCQRWNPFYIVYSPVHNDTTGGICNMHDNLQRIKQFAIQRPLGIKSMHCVRYNIVKGSSPLSYILKRLIQFEFLYQKVPCKTANQCPNVFEFICFQFDGLIKRID